MTASRWPITAGAVHSGRAAGCSRGWNGAAQPLARERIQQIHLAGRRGARVRRQRPRGGQLERSRQAPRSRRWPRFGQVRDEHLVGADAAAEHEAAAIA